MGSRVSKSTEQIIVDAVALPPASYSKLSLENLDVSSDGTGWRLNNAGDADLIANRPVIEKVAALLRPTYRVDGRRRNSSAIEDEAVVDAQWAKADLNHDSMLTKKELALFLHRFNIKLSGAEVELMVERFGESGNQTIGKQQFAELLHSLHSSRQLHHLFEQILIDDGDTSCTTGELTMSPEQLQAFLAAHQQESMSVRSCATIIASCEPGDQHLVFSPDGLHAFLSSPELNSIAAPERLEKPYQDMNQPFTHYFIASSHNTYLLGDQLMGTSSVHAYKEAFANGCKCVELDCWDNDSDLSKPIIYHGHTLTSRIFFVDVCIAIRDYGFSVSPFPVILSLEVHCKVEGQRALARILKEVFGDMIPAPFALSGRFPPPAQLLNKVLLMGKQFADDDEDEIDELLLEDLTCANEGDLVPSKMLVMEMPAEAAEPAKQKKATQAKCTLQQSGSIVKFKALADIKDSDPWIMGNMSELALNKWITNSPAELVEYNSRHLCRIYPRGLRVNSSNFDPQPAWVHGCAIVALNYQTGGEPMFVNNAKFLDNGMCGYVLKPPHLRHPSAFKPANSVVQTLVLTVISARRLPKASGTEQGSVVDPYVRVSISGVPDDCRVCSTRAIFNNGFNPVWEQTFEFPLRVPEMAVLMFVVKDKDNFSDDFIGQYALPVSCVRPGYRAVPLKNHRGRPLPKGSLFVKVEFKPRNKTPVELI
eukprot:TRINITY_DN2962_c0_g1_i1.p1 TRINITY_DN2962_c0_g1~~TRINITY_DN2962_c0_g1_i1.p1  ORF type:complete len:707 (-),score=248.02 TRINITY_DN2962_c0_g1_i1:579-2699(-)